MANVTLGEIAGTPKVRGNPGLTYCAVTIEVGAARLHFTVGEAQRVAAEMATIAGKIAALDMAAE